MGGKSGGTSENHNYHSTLAAIFRAGRVKTLHSILVDGKAIWEGPINRTDFGITNPYTVTLSDSKWLLEGGYIKFYWGEDSQTTPDAALVDHPAYRGVAYAVLHRFLHGFERPQAPNVEFILEAEAEPSASIITSTSNDDGCVNPWAIVAEILTSHNGCGLPVAKLNAASFQAAHDALAATQELRDLTYCAPLLLSQVEAKQAIADILDVCGGFIRWDSQGRIEAVQLDPDPGLLSNYTALDANSITEPPSVESSSWDEVPTGVVVRWMDRDRQFKESSVAVDELRAAITSGATRRVSLERLHVTRRDQAFKLASEWCKRFCQPINTGNISVRPSKAVQPSGARLKPGDRVFIDIDPEPGGIAINQMAIIETIRTSPTGAIQIAWRGEPNQPTYISNPGYTSPVQPDLDVPEVVYARIFTVPTTQRDDSPSVFALVSRPGDLVTGYKVEFDVDFGSGTFTTIGIQNVSSVRGRVKTAYSDTASGVVDFEALDTRDLNLLTDWVGGDSAAENDELLLVVYKLDTGFIDEDSDGLPLLEVFSISAQATTASNRFDLTVLRSRFGTLARAWDVNDEAWIMPRSAMVKHSHTNFPEYASQATDLVFRLRPFTVFAEYTGVPDDLDFRFFAAYVVKPSIAWTTPGTSAYTLASSGDLTPAATIEDIDGDLVKVELYTRRLDTGVVTTHFVLPVSPRSSQTLADALAAASVSTPLNFAGQAGANTIHVLTLRATDASGNVVESSRTLTRPPTSGSTSAPDEPVFQFYDTFSEVDFINIRTVTIDVVSPATQVHWALVTSFGITPPVSYTTVVALTATPTAIQTSRLWARASDGTNHSAWVYIDLFKLR